MDKAFMVKIYNDSEYYNIIKNTITAYCYGINDSDLDDCISEVFMAAMKNENLENHDNIKGWLYLTAKNISMRFLTKKSYDFKHINFDSQYNISCESNLIDDSEKNALYNEMIQKIHKFLTKMESELFNLKFEKMYTDKKISDVTGLSEKYVRVKCNRLRKKLKIFLENMIT